MPASRFKLKIEHFKERSMPNSSALPMAAPLTATSTVLRVDRFTCPLAHWPAFAEKLAFIDGHLQSQPRCAMSRVASSERDGMVFVITIAEWESRDALVSAKQEMAEVYAESGFDPGAFMAEHGITGEFATFDTVAM